MLCDRTREWLALHLDGELSDFERTLMHAHLGRCAACRHFGAEIADITKALRSAPLEQLPAPVTLPARRRLLPTRQLQAVAAAALLLGVAGIGSLYGALQGPAGVTASAPAPVAHGPMVGLSGSSDPLLRDLRVASLRPDGPLPLGVTKPVLKILV